MRRERKLQRGIKGVLPMLLLLPAPECSAGLVGEFVILRVVLQKIVTSVPNENCND